MATQPSSPLKAMRGFVGRLLGRVDSAADATSLAEEDDADQRAERPVDHEAVAQRVAAEQLAQNRSKSNELPKGRQFVVLFDVAAEHFGDRWPKLVNRAKLFAENVLENRLGDRFAMREDGDDGVTFVILDEALSEEDIELLGAALMEAIQRRLTGGDDVDDPVLSGLAQPEPVVDEATSKTPDAVEEDELTIPAAEAAIEGTRVSSFDYGADEPEPEFADGWEFTEGPEGESNAGTSEDLAGPDAGIVDGSGDRAEEQFAIPVTSERSSEEGLWESTQDIEEARLETPLAGDRDDPPVGEFSSEEIAQATFDFGTSDDAADETPLPVPTADSLLAPEFEIPTSGDRPDEALIVPTSGDQDQEAPALFESGGELPDTELDIPTADTRDEPEAPIPVSEDRIADSEAEFAPTQTRTEDDFDIPTSEDLADQQAEFGLSETKDEVSVDVAVSDDVPTAETPVYDSTDSVTEDNAEHAMSLDRDEPKLGDFGQSETREDESAAVPVSEDRVEPETPAFGQSETLAEQSFDTPLSADREAESPPEFGASDAREEQELAIPISEDREEAAIADFGQSDTKPDAEYAVPQSADREEPAIADFGRSETKPDDVYEVPLSDAREIAAGQADFGRSETREEPSYAVPISQDREETLPPDFGRSETRDEPIREIVVEQTSERETPEVVLVPIEKQPAAAAQPPIKTIEDLPLNEVRLRYGAWLDVRTDVVTTYLADPCTRRFDGSETQYHHLLGDGPSPEVCFMLDCLMLEQANAQVTQVFAEGGVMILGLPVAATTLARPKYRAEYLRRFKTIDESMRKMTRLIAYQLPQTSASQASDLFGWLRSMARPPIVRVPPRTELLAPLATHGAYGVSINFGKWSSELGDETFARRLHKITQQARLLNLRVVTTNLPDRKAIETAIMVGVDLIEIKVLQSAAAIPRRLVKIDRAALLRKA